jgi:DNA-binding GntR family transcriptional regulator
VVTPAISARANERVAKAVMASSLVVADRPASPVPAVWLKNSADCSMFGIDCAQSIAQSDSTMPIKPRPGKLVGLSNSRNRPKVSGSEDVYNHLLNSIVDQRLPPGTKLNELTLCEIFNIGRRQVSQVLVRLAHDELVELHANRGAFVSSPDVETAKAIFEARRALEDAIVRLVAANMTPEQFSTIKKSVDDEAAHRRANRLREAIRLSGEFHILLGRFSGNPIFATMIKMLVARTSLVVSLYENQDTMVCWHDDHGLLLKHLEARAVGPASTLMRKHLAEIEKSLALDRPAPAPFDLRAIYSPTG